MRLLQSYHLEEVENNVWSLLINLRNKSTAVQYQHNGEFWLWDEQEDILLQEEVIEGIPENGYSHFLNRNKDQIHYVFIPTYQIINGERKKEYHQNKL